MSSRRPSTADATQPASYSRVSGRAQRLAVVEDDESQYHSHSLSHSSGSRSSRSNIVDLADAFYDTFSRAGPSTANNNNNRSLHRQPSQELYSSRDATPPSVPSSRNTTRPSLTQLEGPSYTTLAFGQYSPVSTTTSPSAPSLPIHSESGTMRRSGTSSSRPSSRRPSSAAATVPPQPTSSRSAPSALPPPPIPIPPPPPSAQPSNRTAPTVVSAISRKTSRVNISAPSTAKPSSGERISSSTRDLREREKPKFRHIPHLPNFNPEKDRDSSTPPGPTSAATMHWNRAPVHGYLPARNFRAHTVTLIDDTAWLFAGTDEGGCWNDVYCFDIETFMWTHPETSGDVPPPCRAHSATAIDGTTQILVFGGGDGATYFNTLYLFDTMTYKWTKFNPEGPLPPPRRAHTSVMYDNSLYIFGGGTGAKALGDLWSLDVTQPQAAWAWKSLNAHIRGPKPQARGYHTANLVNNSMVVIGGSDGGVCFGDVWLLDLDNLIWKEVLTIEEPDKPRLLAHTATQVGSYLFVIGGHDGSKYRKDVRLFNLVTLRFEPKAVAGRAPCSRGYHVTLLADGRVFLFGGFDGQKVYDDVWILDLAASAYLAQVTIFTVDGDCDAYDRAVEDGEYDVGGEIGPYGEYEYYREGEGEGDRDRDNRVARRY